MSSTTEQERGQVLVLFAGALVALLMVAALAFDVGSMLLERRDQQNAADAAAIAGARYLPGDAANAKQAARDVATANGFTASSSVSVEPLVPPGPGTSSRYRSKSSIEVTISSTRPSIFAGVMGVLGWPVGARAVATNQDDIAAPYAILALEEHQCSALYVGGGGQILVNGNLQVNSDCDDPGRGALERKAGAILPLNVEADPALCSVVGTIKSAGSGSLTCTQEEFARPVDDPLADLPAPPLPDAPAPAMYLVSGTAGLKPPDGCPGSDNPATVDAPTLCKFVPSADYQTAVWRMYPGLYPGGIDLQVGTFYLEPGIYWIGGGGFQAGGNGVTLMSVATGKPGPTAGGGILLYNSGLPASPIGKIVLNGADATISLLPLQDGSIWKGLVVFMDRTDIGGDSVDDVTINGGSSELDVRGTIYVPDGQIQVNGSGGTIVIDQIIADQFKVTGAGGTIKALYDADFVVKFIAAGLVE